MKKKKLIPCGSFHKYVLKVSTCIHTYVCMYRYYHEISHGLCAKFECITLVCDTIQVEYFIPAHISLLIP